MPSASRSRSFRNGGIASPISVGSWAGAARLGFCPGCHQRAMKSCITFMFIGMPLALLGLWLDSEHLMALGAGAIAAVVIGWPGLLLMGLLHKSGRR